jgi:AraC-like DNA-binding protein
VATVAPAVLINPPGDRLGTCNAIVSGVVAAREPDNHVVSDFAGPLSIKFMVAGTGFWETPDGFHRVESDVWLVLNEGQRYSLHMQGGSPRESFCAMFERGFVAAVARALRSGDDELLEAPAQAPSRSPGFFEHLRPGEPAVPGQLRRMRDRFRAGIDADTIAWLEEELHVLAELLLRADEGERRAIEDVPAARAATREELWRRLHRGRDWLHAHAAEPASLAETARAACLSPHHFLRAFHRAFGVTPHRYLQRLRLERARALLARRDASVTEVCLAVGFASLGSFSALFRREVGVSPRAWRAGRRSDSARSEKTRDPSPG